MGREKVYCIYSCDITILLAISYIHKNMEKLHGNSWEKPYTNYNKFLKNMKQNSTSFSYLQFFFVPITMGESKGGKTTKAQTADIDLEQDQRR